jgi:hypothetical protein
MSTKITNYFTSSQPAKKCKVNHNSVKTEDVTTVLCDTASAVDHVESEHMTLPSENLPECWHFNKKNKFCNRYEWLVIKIKNMAAELVKQLVF